MDLKTAVRSIPDFPKPGILFRDVTTLFQNPEAFRQLIDELAKSLEGKQVDLVVGPEARGFVVGSALAYALNAGLVLARKPGKLPESRQHLRGSTVIRAGRKAGVHMEIVKRRLQRAHSPAAASAAAMA